MWFYYYIINIHDPCKVYSFRFQCGSINTLLLDIKKYMQYNFRFQCGSIITVSSSLLSAYITSFRFQCGSIITLLICSEPGRLPSLDSNVVLLLLKETISSALKKALQIPMWFYYYLFLLEGFGDPYVFRFQCGSIITHTFTIQQK